VPIYGPSSYGRAQWFAIRVAKNKCAEWFAIRVAKDECAEWFAIRVAKDECAQWFAIRVRAFSIVLPGQPPYPWLPMGVLYGVELSSGTLARYPTL